MTEHQPSPEPQTITIKRASGGCGAFVTGVDLGKSLCDASFARIKQALFEHAVLFFPGQHISPAEQITFARRFGNLHVHPYAPNLGTDYPEVLVLNERAKGSVKWHTDSTYEKCPPLGSLLHALILPSVGGDTIWADMRAAYEALSPAMQRFLCGLHAIHGGEKIRPLMTGRGDNLDKPMLSARHPVVIKDPHTGRKALFVSEDYTARIEELGIAESDAMLGMLFRHSIAPEFQVRLRWEPKMLAFWYNAVTQHYPVPDYTEPRLMYRITVLLDTPLA